jgi:hypothetical protein
MYDENDTETTIADNATRYVYNITVLKLITGTSALNIFAAAKTSAARLAVELPTAV